MRKSLFLRILVCLFLTTACLKTRSQIRGEDSDHTKGGNRSTSQAQAPIGSYAVDELRSEITRIHGRIEDLERKDNSSETEMIEKLEKRIQELESAQLQILDELKKLNSKVPVSDPVSLYKKGIRDHRSGKLKSAIGQFDAYLASKAKRKRHEQDAIFYRGESYFRQKKYKKAILDYSRFAEDYPKSKYQPKALLKTAQSFDAMGMKKDARLFYQELADKFPRSAEGKKALAKLKPKKKKRLKTVKTKKKKTTLKSAKKN